MPAGLQQVVLSGSAHEPTIPLGPRAFGTLKLVTIIDEQPVFGLMFHLIDNSVVYGYFPDL